MVRKVDEIAQVAQRDRPKVDSRPVRARFQFNRFNAFDDVDSRHNFSPTSRILTDSRKNANDVIDRKDRRWVESQILPPDVPLFILKGEAQQFVQHSNFRCTGDDNHSSDKVFFTLFKQTSVSGRQVHYWLALIS
jgi:hypothetical protein